MRESAPVDHEKEFPPGTLVDFVDEAQARVELGKDADSLVGGTCAVYKTVYPLPGVMKKREWIAYLGSFDMARISRFDPNRTFPNTEFADIKPVPVRLLKRRGS